MKLFGSRAQRAAHAPFTSRPLYCPMTTSSMAMGRMERSSFTFSFRMSSASSDTGGSIANSAITCSKWFCMMSRMMP